LRLLVRRKGEDRPAERPVPGERGLADRRTPARDRVLHRLRPDARLASLKQRGRVAQPVELGQGLANHAERLVEARLALLELHPEAQELVWLVAASETELEPPAAQAVDHRRLLHDPDRV